MNFDLGVLVVNNTSLNNVEGLYEYNLCRKLEEEKVKVTSLTLFGDNSSYCKDAHVISSRCSFLPKRALEIYSSFIHRILLNGEFDIVHLNSALWSFLPLQVSLLNKFLVNKHKPVVLTTHSFYPKYQKSLVKAVKQTILKFDPYSMLYGIRCFALKYVDKIVCLSEPEKKFLLSEFDLPQHKMVVIPNGVDLTRSKKPSYNFRKQHKIPSEFMLLYVGQLIKIKGLTCLLRALKIILDAGFDCALVIITYNRRENVMAEARKLGVHKKVYLFDYFEQYLSDVDLISAYRACDVFILPSLTESLPTVLLEAMMCEKPVIATNVGGIPELVSDNHNGFLVKPMDAHALAEKTIRLLESPSKRKRMGENGYLLVKQKYDWNILVSRVLRLYESLTH